MVKEPIAGRVKTRLARDCGTAHATRFLRTNLSLTLLRLARDPRWNTILYVAPGTARASRMFPFHLERRDQGGGDLGARLARVVASAPPGPLLIIGADIPGIRARDIAAATRALHGNDAVFGPAGDGGYWLVGLSARARRRGGHFDNIRWSSPHALADTLANFADRPVALIAAKDDADEGADLARLSPLIGRLIV